MSSGRERLDKSLEKIERQFSNQYRKAYEEKREHMPDWPRRTAVEPTVNLEEIIQIEEQLWNS
jgi:DNA-binding SARP family transcriptional activator